MKQILFLIVLALVGYFIFWGGTTNVLYRADMNPKNLLTNIVSGVDENFLPEVDPSRNGFKYTNADSFNKIKENIFLTYDPDTCFSLVDLVYSSGSKDSEPLMRQYLNMFSLPEDRSRILSLLKSYKDKQTLRILLSFYKNSSISKVSVLNALAEYHTPEVAQLIKKASSSEDLVLSQTAQNLIDSFADKKWYQEGLKVNLEANTKAVAKKDFESQMAQY